VCKASTFADQLPVLSWAEVNHRKPKTEDLSFNKWTSQGTLKLMGRVKIKTWLLCGERVLESGLAVLVNQALHVFGISLLEITVFFLKPLKKYITSLAGTKLFFSLERMLFRESVIF
jgi:hypothetical protein